MKGIWNQVLMSLQGFYKVEGRKKMNKSQAIQESVFDDQISVMK